METTPQKMQGQNVHIFLLTSPMRKHSYKEADVVVREAPGRISRVRMSDGFPNFPNSKTFNMATDATIADDGTVRFSKKMQILSSRKFNYDVKVVTNFLEPPIIMVSECKSEPVGSQVTAVGRVIQVIPARESTLKPVILGQADDNDDDDHQKQLKLWRSARQPATPPGSLILLNHVVIGQLRGIKNLNSTYMTRLQVCLHIEQLIALKTKSTPSHENTTKESLT
ncbi:uncharacterized protein [Haliotis cracherodii]|uniref:uncharacterized protein n=1 Tax=Haliotis cracherodii TaxID=6455 RepID=UPI0039EB1EB0